ncbi:MAG: hypothetical protein WCE90_09890 [Candidatus Zixiibacteriota bacterium]
MCYIKSATIAGQGLFVTQNQQSAELAISQPLLAVIANNQLLKVAGWAFVDKLLTINHPKGGEKERSESSSGVKTGMRIMLLATSER